MSKHTGPKLNAPEFNREKLLIIGAGPLQTPAIIRAAQMGLTVLATDFDPAAPGFAHAHKHAVVSTTDPAANADFAAKNKVHGALTLATDVPLLSVAAVSERLGLGIISTAAAKRATNKYLMKKTLAAAAVPVPAFIPARSAAEATAAARKLGWPVVTKPLFGSASRGVQLIHTPEQLETAFAQARAVAKKNTVLIEKLATGKHICAEAFTWKKQTKILCIIDRELTPPPRFVELRHTFPSSLPRKTLDQITAVALAGIKALGIKSGPSHIDMILTKNGPVISEIGARLDGDYKSSHFMPLVYGYDIIADAIRAAMGRTPVLFSPSAPPMIPKTAICIHYFTPRPGIVKSAAGAPSASKIPGIAHLELNIQSDSEIRPLTSSQDRIGVAIATAPTSKLSRQTAKSAEDKIIIKYN